jgi:hypothetical protein
LSGWPSPVRSSRRLRPHGRASASVSAAAQSGRRGSPRRTQLSAVVAGRRPADGGGSESGGGESGGGESGGGESDESDDDGGERAARNRLPRAFGPTSTALGTTRGEFREAVAASVPVARAAAQTACSGSDAAVDCGGGGSGGGGGRLVNEAAASSSSPASPTTAAAVSSLQLRAAQVSECLVGRARTLELMRPFF